jgi:molybdopterin molybdotransferase
MISVEEAESIINSHGLKLEFETVPLAQAGGRVLYQEIRADRDFPPFDRVTMDGIAINYNHWQQEKNEFTIVGVQPAGSPPLQINGSGQAIEVMTGAVLPKGADTVIPYEVITLNGESEKTASIPNPPKQGQNVHRRGTDRSVDSVIVKKGTVIGAPEIGIAATVGSSKLPVLRTPRVAIISTGDELVAIDQNPLQHQIRSSNAATLSNALEEWNIKADLYHIIDDLEGTTHELQKLLGTYQILILSGGVSKGKFDYVPAALTKLQVHKHFHKIRQRPGKPFWFGSHDSGTLVFAFPGNPVSSFMCFNRYLKPWINGIFGLPSTALKAKLASDITFEPDLTYFAQVKIYFNQATVYAQPVEGHGSGDLANLVDADGFLELTRGKSRFEKGELYPLYPYRSKT